MLRRTLLSILLTAVAATSAVKLEKGGVFIWEGLTLFAPSPHWTVNEGEGVVALYRRSEGGLGYVAGNLFLEEPDGKLLEAIEEGSREGIVEELTRYLAGNCRLRYGQAFDLERYDAKGAEPAAALFFLADGRKIRAYAFLTRSGVYLLHLAYDPEDEDRLAPELDRLAGELTFR